MNRILSTLAIAALTLAAVNAGGAPAPARAETSTYVDGNVTGVSPNTGGTLMLSDEKAMYFRTGLANVPVPYANITNVELGATKETSHDVPAYKVWKRFEKKTQTQLLIVNFKSDEGEEKNMTLELAKTAVPGVVSAIQAHGVKDVTASTAVAKAEPSGKTSKAARNDIQKEEKPEDKTWATTNASKKPDAQWWGDDFWKTQRNSDKWNSKTAASTANDQR
jgi:hypothetical protein